MAERPWHDQWIKRDPNGPPPKRERGAPGSGSGWGWALLGAGALARMAYEALWDRNRRWETHWEERQFETRQQNQAWKHREDSATARGGGRFKNMHVNPDAEEFHQRAAERDYARGRRVLPEQSTATAPNTPPSSSGRVGGRTAQEWAEFDVRMRAREAATEAEMWADDPEGMARQARERAAATGEPLDPRAQRGLVRRGAAGVEVPPASAPGGSGGAVAAEPGVDLEGMKRVFSHTEASGLGGRLRGLGRVGLRAAPWVAGAVAAYGVYRGMKDRGGVSWKNAPGAVGDEAVATLEGTARALAPGKQYAWAITQGVKNIRTVGDWIFGGGTGGNAGGAGGASAPAFATEEEARAFYSEDGGDERMPAVGGSVPLPGPVLPSLPGGRAQGSVGWGEVAARKKRGKPFADPYGIGQARLEAEHDLDEQNEADQREAKRQQRDERKADNYIAYIEREDRKNERARLASERRQIDFENDSDWLAQRKAWEEQRLERGSRRRHASINVNSWQAAGAVVGGFSQINVELVRSEIERALERGDTAIRMN